MVEYLQYVIHMFHCGVENVDSIDITEMALLRYLKSTDGFHYNNN